LRQLADFAEIRGVSNEASDWRRLASELERATADEIRRLPQLAARGRLDELTTVHPGLHWRIEEVLSSPGRAAATALAGLPWLFHRLIALDAVDSAAAAALARGGIATLIDLQSVLQDGRLPAGLADRESAIRDAAQALWIDRPRVTLGRAVDTIDNLLLLIAAAAPAVEGLTPAGDVRRFEPLVDRLAIVGSAADTAGTLDGISEIPTLRVLHRTARRALVAFHQSEVDIRMAAPDEYGTVLHAATGSSAHVAAMRARQSSVRLCAREADVYAQGGLAWIPPELRHANGEIEAAAEGRLPDLVAREHIRGDLHMHTTYSDGRDPLVEMVQMSATLGYEYIAITDHSERAGAPKTVNRDTLARQRDEIARLQERFSGLTILHGIEVDIMPDGRLDFPDAVLEPLDIVLASLHDHAGHDPDRLTRRCLSAIAHPLVNIITHPANRLVGRDRGYALHFPGIYEAAAATGTALEIDGAPSHLDLDGERAREAIAAGVTVSIDSDCHKAGLLDRQMRMGVGTARRGWVEPRHVLTTRPLPDVRAFVAAKRGSKG
jgi:DNA polymerase (family 10)